MVHEYKCICQTCASIFTYTDDDIKEDKYNRQSNFNNAMRIVTANSSLEKTVALSNANRNFRDFDKCPNCGSKKITKTETYFNTDNQGNYISDATDKEIEAYNNRIQIPSLSSILMSIATMLNMIGIGIVFVVVIYILSFILRIFA